MTPIEIKIELLKKKITMASIARQFNPPVDRSAVAHVIEKGWISARIMHAVADAIGYDVKYVFPEYFLKRKKTR